MTAPQPIPNRVADDSTEEYRAYRKVAPIWQQMERAREDLRRLRMQQAAKGASVTAPGAGPSPAQSTTIGAPQEVLEAEYAQAERDFFAELGKPLPLESLSLLGRATRSAQEVTPRVVAGGLLDLARNVVGAVEDFSNAAAGALGIVSLEELTGQRLSELIPTIPEPTTPEGQIARDFVPFLVAFGGAVTRIRGALGGGKAARIGEDLLAGAVADALAIDTSEENFSEFLAQYPELSFLPEFLRADPDDSGAEERAKEAFLGSALGVFGDTGFEAIKALRRKVIARSEARAAIRAQRQAAAAAEQARVSEEGILLSPGFKREDPLFRLKKGEPERKLARAAADVEKRLPPGAFTQGDPAAVIRDAAETRLGTESLPDLELNLDRMTDEESVKQLFVDVTTNFREQIDRARRGKQTTEQTLRNADKLQLSLEEMLGRPVGRALNDFETIAFRKILSAANNELDRLSKVVTDEGPGPGDENLFRFRKMMAVHLAITEEVLGARAEAGRALRAWSIDVGGEIERARAIRTVLDSAGGSDTVHALATRYRAMVETGATPQMLNAFTRKGVFARTVDAVRESYVMGLLWSPKTHIVNTASPYIVALQQIVERGAAAGFSRLAGRTGEDAVAFGESMALAYGLSQGIKSIWTLASQGLREAGIRGMVASVEQGRAALGIPRTTKLDDELGRISSRMLGLEPQGAVGRAIDVYGKVTRIPGTALGFEDDMGKMVGYVMELHAQAFRKAWAEGGSRQEIAARIADIVSNPPEDVRLAALDHALYTTFTNEPGKLGQRLQQLRDAGPLSSLVITTVLPFVRTPANILRYTFERSPLAPLVTQWRDDIARGGVQRDLALARMSLGTIATLTFMDLAGQGYIRGDGPAAPGDRESLQNLGYQTNSIVLGENATLRINRLDALGMHASMAATLTEKMRLYEMDSDALVGLNELMAAMITASASTAMSKTWLTGLTRISDAVRIFQKAESGADLEAASFYIENLGRSAVPFSSALSALTEASAAIPGEEQGTFPDPSGWDFVQSLVPIWERGLTRRRNRWGETIPTSEVFLPFDVVNPAKIKPIVREPIDEEIVLHQMDIRKIGKRGSFLGVPVSFRSFPEAYELYVQLAGNEMQLRVPGVRETMGQKDYLNAIVTGEARQVSEHYADQTPGPDGGKRDMVQSIRNDYRERAQDLLMFPEEPRNRRLVESLPAELQAVLQSREVERFREFVRTEGDRLFEARTGRSDLPRFPQ